MKHVPSQGGEVVRLVEGEETWVAESECEVE